LSAFLETVRQGGVAQAGMELGMTQPAVSKAIAELEAIMGVALFDRSRRALSLTQHGEMFERFAQAGLATLRQGLETIEEARSGTKFIAFGALPTVAASVVPEALSRFTRSSFASRVVVESGPSPYLLELLRTVAIDFVVGRAAQPSAMEGLSFEFLYSEDLALVVRPGHPLADSQSVDLAVLAEYQLLMPPRQAIIRPAVDALLIAAGIGRPVNEIETVSNSLGRSYTLLSDAIWIISSGGVARDIEAGQLVRLPVDVSGTQGAVGITTRSGAELPLPAHAMLDCIRQAAAASGP
jgi:LysR family pca operon transcriptional activator